MTAIERTPHLGGAERSRQRGRALAAAARSILACPASASLVVDGVDDVLAGLDDLGMVDHDGRPTFSCPPATPLAVAADQGSSALLTLESGLGRPGSPDREGVLTLAGRLVPRGVRSCGCCEETRVVLALDVTYAVLSRRARPGQPDRPADGPTDIGGVSLAAAGQARVDPRALTHPDLVVNRGFLQRAGEHATAFHQHELRSAVATLTGVRLAEVVGVALDDLRADGVTLHWVSPAGAHTRHLRFPVVATTPQQVGEQLRSQLHAGLC